MTGTTTRPAPATPSRSPAGRLTSSLPDARRADPVSARRPGGTPRPGAKRPRPAAERQAGGAAASPGVEVCAMRAVTSQLSRTLWPVLYLAISAVSAAGEFTARPLSAVIVSPWVRPAPADGLPGTVASTNTP